MVLIHGLIFGGLDVSFSLSLNQIPLAKSVPNLIVPHFGLGLGIGKSKGGGGGRLWLCLWLFLEGAYKFIWAKDLDH